MLVRHLHICDPGAGLNWGTFIGYTHDMSARLPVCSTGSLEEGVSRIAECRPSAVCFAPIGGSTVENASSNVGERRVALICVEAIDVGLIRDISARGHAACLLFACNRASHVTCETAANQSRRLLRHLENDDRDFETIVVGYNLVAAAKFKVMKEGAMSERDAYDFMRRTAMRKRLPMTSLARSILKAGAERPCRVSHASL